MHRALFAIFAISVVSGCALQSPPERDDVRREALPNLALPSQWAAKGGAPGAISTGWLATFKDPQLDALVREAIANNPDLRVAAARVEQAAGYARLAGAALYPQVNVMARGGGKMSGDSSGLQGAGIFASWEIDLWGRVRAGRDAARLQYESAELDAEYARQSIAALVAKSWFLAIEARLQKGIAEDMLLASQKLLGLAEDRRRIGKGDEYEVTVAQASLQTYVDVIQQLDLSYQQALRALEALAGRYPAAAVEIPASLAAKPGPVPAGMPSELLERRPDVVAAERRVAAAFYRVEEAKAARLPRISLTGSGTSVSSELFVLKNHDNPVWGIGASLTAPIFTGGALQSQVEIRTSEQMIAVADYGRIGARAFGEVENALSSEFNLDARSAALGRAVAENTRALELAGVRYRVGSADLRAVQQQQIALYSARTTLLRVQAEQLVQRINLYLALGGGWAVPADSPERSGLTPAPSVAGAASAPKN
ncbi:MAG TPA: efflux transporter outer membrane subunit [Burkholderiales bacterium]|nr:efflux transporter outer membrane subunit [Burkholderiales bacterium]